MVPQRNDYISISILNFAKWKGNFLRAKFVFLVLRKSANAKNASESNHEQSRNDYAWVPQEAGRGKLSLLTFDERAPRVAIKYKLSIIITSITNFPKPKSLFHLARVNTGASADRYTVLRCWTSLVSLLAHYWVSTFAIRFSFIQCLLFSCFISAGRPLQ